MIRLLPNYLSAFLLVTFFIGCDKDERDINLNLTPVQTLYAPDDNLSVKLQPATGATVVFEWETAKAEDGTLVMYELAFDEADGDFSEPVYKITSDGNGIQNKMTLTHKDLNKIADLAGIEALSTGNLKWTAFAYKGTNVVRGETARTITVERPAGFSSIPSDIYLSGDATEAGADLGNAIQMKMTDAGIFEAFTTLKAGTLKFTDAKEGSPLSFQLEGAFIKEGEGSTSPVTAEAAYRIVLDFNTASATLTEIIAVEYYFSPNDSYDAQLTYKGGGIWSAENVPIEFRQESWGRDERYKFRMKGKDANGDEVEMFWGSSNRDNQRATADSPPAYFHLVESAEFNRWDNTFKFQTEADMKNTDIVMKFAPGEEYTHQIIIK